MIRRDFPFFNLYNSTIFVDSASSSQKPKCMLDKMYEFYSYTYTNIHRGSYNLSLQLTKHYEDIRDIIAKFINASSTYEIIFTSGATASINFIINTFDKKFLLPGDEVIISNIDHHSNIITWQQLCKRKLAILTVLTVKRNGDININTLKKIIINSTRIISISQLSNVLGSMIDIQSIIKFVKSKNIIIIVDASQSISHIEINVQKLDCDLLFFSAHKIYGPNSLGILYVKYSMIIKMEILNFGSATLDYMSLDKTKFLPPPYRFEPGTPHICEVISFGETIKYLSNINIKYFWNREENLIKFLLHEIKKLNNLYILNVKRRKSIISIVNLKMHFEDAGNIINKSKIALRIGTHCSKPLIDFLCIEGVIRISIGLYNNYFDIINIVNTLKKINSIY